MINPQTLKRDFPLFRHQPSLVYLDSAATTLKPRAVIDAEREYMEQYSANVGRGLYPLAEIATEKFEAVREQVTHFIGATSAREIIFTSGTTAAINLIAQLLEKKVSSKDNIVVTDMEHHSNYLPWKELTKRTEAEFRTIPFTGKGLVDPSALEQYIDQHTVLVAFSAVSNVLGTINSTQEIIHAIRNINPKTLILVDAAQAVGHMPINVISWNADFVAFSGHKMFGPTGIGVLYGKSAVLESLAPVMFGGGMVLDTCAPQTLYKEIPYRFEAGTPNIAGVIALGAAIQYIEGLGLENIHTHEKKLTEYALQRLRKTFGQAISIVGPEETTCRGSIIAFTLKGIHPHDIAHILGERNMCVRAGEHCAAPLHRTLGLSATTRISLSIYNSEEDIDSLIEKLKNIVSLFNHQPPNPKIQGKSNDQ